MDCPNCGHENPDGAPYCANAACSAPLPKDPQPDPILGTVIKETFHVVSLIGEGGMGKVYVAEQQMGTTKRRVAIKTLHPHYSNDPKVIARFNRECGTVTELEHPNTIKFYDFGRTRDGQLFIAMEFVVGPSLGEELAQRGPIPPERVDRILEQVCGSLEEAHQKGIVHRDLKPDNIILTTRAGVSDYVKVLDFGIAKRSEAPDEKEQKLTQQGMVLGTPPYMSPEQFTGKEVTHASDIYSLGVIAYEMLTGRLPFDADTPWQWATQHMTQRPFPFETIPVAANIPQKMKAAILRALSKNAAERPATARQFHEELSVGAGRGSLLGLAGAPAPSAGGGPVTAAMPATASPVARSGQTQMGEPLFVGGMAGGGPVPNTLVEPGAPGHVPIPTASGHAFPTGPTAAVPPAPPRRGTPLAATIGAVVVVGGGIAAFFALRGSSAEEDDPPVLATSAAPQVVLTSTPPPPAPTGGGDPIPPPGPVGTPASAGGKKTTGGGTSPTSTPTSTATPTTTATTPPPQQDGTAACEQAMSLARVPSTQAAVNAYRSCSGPKQGEARAAIANGAAIEVKFKDCATAKAAHAAASSIGAGHRSALELKNKKCP